MLYKVTAALISPRPQAPQTAEEKPAPKARKRRATALFDSEGNEVLITLMCLKCKCVKPLSMFGLRKMGDGAVRNQPWCRGCRSGAATSRRAEATAAASAAVAG